AAVNAGNYATRLQLSEQHLYKLRQIPEHMLNAPWSIHSPPRTMIYPGPDAYPPVRVTTASSVTVDNEWVTYVLDGDDWVQCVTAPDDQNVILVCALLNDNNRLKREISGLKVDLQNERAQAEVYRGFYEKHQPKPRSYKGVILALLILFIALFVPTANAEITTQTTHARNPEDLVRLNDQLESFIKVALERNYTKQVTDYFNQVYKTSVEAWYMKIWRHVELRYSNIQTTPYREAIIQATSMLAPRAWQIVAVILSLVTVWKAVNPIPTLLYLAAATITDMDFALVAIAPLQTAYTSMVVVFLACNYFVDPLVSVALSILHLAAFTIIGLFLADVDYILNLRAACATTFVFTGFWVLNTLQIPTAAVTGIVVAWRIWRLASTLPPNVIEVRDTTGKVVTKVAQGPGYLMRFKQAFRNPLYKLRQLRKTTVPLARVNPAALCHISVTDTTGTSKGTGFFCGNYIVTAAHVIGTAASVNINYNGHNYTTTVKKKGTKDYACLNIPAALNNCPRLKISKKHDCTWVCLCAPDGSGAYLTSVVEGFEHDGAYSYPCPTRDGMSGAPLLDVDGHVLGLHQTNTGYTGGAIRLDLEDIQDQPKENPKVNALEAEIAALKAQLAAAENATQARLRAIQDRAQTQPVQQKPPLPAPAKPPTPTPSPPKPAPSPAPKAPERKLEQSMTESDIVGLVRAAISREVQILRDELDGFQQKKKGKTKHGRGRKHVGGAGRSRQRGPVFTEEEYEELQNEGWEADEIRAMVDAMYDEMYGGYGYPEYDDPDSEDDREIEEAWFGGRGDGNDHGYRQRHMNPLKFYIEKIWKKESVDEMLQSTCPLEEKLCAKELEAVKKAKEDQLPVCLAALDRRALDCGLAPFSDGLEFKQRKQQPKNREAGGSAPQAGSSGLADWKQLAGPPFRMLVPSDYPVLCSLPLDRPIYDYDHPDDPLLGYLPAVDCDDTYEPTTWGREAYAKSFEKFHYATPCDFARDYPTETAFADWAWRRHHSYLEDTRVIHITATEKNTDSTPAYPKMLDYATEEDFLSENGWGPYIKAFKAIDAGEEPPVLWYLFLKKEILKTSKIKDADIRQIVCADPIYARIGACFEQHQNQLMKKHTETHSGQCGWSPFEGGFERICRRLTSKTGKFVEFDWTRFDGTIPTQLFMRIKRMRFQFLDPKQQDRYEHIYRWYCKNLVRRYVLLPSGEVTKQTRGNPSGQISTTMDNNLVNYWLQAFEFCYFFGPNKELWEDYDTICYGDDRLSRYPQIPYDYQKRVVDMYRDIFGMWVKPEKVKVSDTLVGLTFCGFRVGPNFQPYPADEHKLFSGLVKPAKKLPSMEALHGKLLSLQILMHNHPPSAFKDYIEMCLMRTAILCPRLPARLTDRQLDWLWRGGPKPSPNG
ncbi:nonstructural protein, partial [Rodent astrovirus]|uniref:nonstructural protein n=1 Tax=Rodent astrovirus TaxID=1914442 RepID=UPI000C7ED5DF